MPRARGPSRQEVLASADRTVPDVIAPGLRVLFCGINPGLYTAWAGHHFARPGNRFWPALHRSGWTPRQLRPDEESELLELGLGVTNVVARATATAAELSTAEMVAGGQRLKKTVVSYRPAVLAVLGVTAYRSAFSRRAAQVGEQPESMGRTRVWVLPNPSGLNAHFTLDRLASCFADMRSAVS